MVTPHIPTLVRVSPSECSEHSVWNPYRYMKLTVVSARVLDRVSLPNSTTNACSAL